MSSIERRLERVAEAISDRTAGCTCDGQGLRLVIRFVGPGDPPQQPAGPRERGESCARHKSRLRFERFDPLLGEYVECDPKEGRS